MQEVEWIRFLKSKSQVTILRHPKYMNICTHFWKSFSSQLGLAWPLLNSTPYNNFSPRVVSKNNTYSILHIRAFCPMSIKTNFSRQLWWLISEKYYIHNLPFWWFSFPSSQRPVLHIYSGRNCSKWAGMLFLLKLIQTGWQYLNLMQLQTKSVCLGDV